MVRFFWWVLRFFNSLKLVFENCFGTTCKVFGGQCCEVRRNNHIHLSELNMFSLFFRNSILFLPAKEMETFPTITLYMKRKFIKLHSVIKWVHSL